MKEKNTNSHPYAIRAFIKPSPKQGVKFKGRSFKGIVFANSPKEAGRKTKELLIKAFEASSADVAENVIHIKECNLYKDFLIPPE